MKVKIDIYTNIDELIEAAETDEQRREAVKEAVTDTIKRIENKHPMPLTNPLYGAVLGLLRSYQKRDEKLHYVGDLPKLERLDAVEVVECSTIPKIGAIFLANRVSQCSVNGNVFSLIEDFFKSVAGSIEVKERPTEENGFKLILRRNTADFGELLGKTYRFYSTDEWKQYGIIKIQRNNKLAIEECLHDFEEKPPKGFFAPQYEVNDKIKEKLTILSRCEMVNVDESILIDCVRDANFAHLMERLSKNICCELIHFIHQNILTQGLRNKEESLQWQRSAAKSINEETKHLLKAYIEADLKKQYEERNR